MIEKAEDFLGSYWSGARIATGTCKFGDLPRLRQVILDRPAESNLNRRLKEKSLAIELGHEVEILTPNTPITIRIEGHGFVAVLIDGGPGGMKITSVRVRHDICLVLSDIDLAGKHNGIAFAQWAVRYRPDLKTVLISGRIEPAPGAVPETVDFIPEPLDFDDSTRSRRVLLSVRQPRSAQGWPVRSAAPGRKHPPLH